MKSEDLQEFEGKHLKIVLKTNFIYKGEIVSLGTDHLKFSDQRTGLMLISYEDISIVLISEEKNK